MPIYYTIYWDEYSFSDAAYIHHKISFENKDIAIKFALLLINSGGANNIKYREESFL